MKYENPTYVLVILQLKRVFESVIFWIVYLLLSITPNDLVSTPHLRTCKYVWLLELLPIACTQLLPDQMVYSEQPCHECVWEEL